MLANTKIEALEELLKERSLIVDLIIHINTVDVSLQARKSRRQHRR